jgi:short-subunit dehydrogenase
MRFNLKSVAVLGAGIAGTGAIGSVLAIVAAKKIWDRLRTGGYTLSGKTVVITGGSRGLGLALARRFADENAKVAILARDKQTLERARVKLSRRNTKIMAVPCDVTDRGQLEAALERVRHHFGSIDVLVNNAGLIAVGPMESMTLRDYSDSLNLHFWAPLHAALAVMREMRRHKEGRIVNISSIGGKISVPHLLPYSAGKFALSGFSEGLRSEVAKDGIRVTSVYPGLMRTGSPRNATFKSKHRSEYAWFSVSDSLPGLSIGADRAARKIVTACKRGDSHLIVSLPAKVAIKLNHLLPATSSSVLSAVNRVLPGPGGIGKRSRKGEQSKSWISPSWLTALDELAARRNNEAVV